MTTLERQDQVLDLYDQALELYEADDKTGAAERLRTAADLVKATDPHLALAIRTMARRLAPPPWLVLARELGRVFLAGLVLAVVLAIVSILFVLGGQQ